MNNFKTLSLILLAALPCLSARGQDYYKGQTSLKAVDNEYEIHYYNDADTSRFRNSTSIYISNKGIPDTRKTLPYLTDTWEVLYESLTFDYDAEELENIIKEVFTPEEIQKYYESRNYIVFSIIINPETGRPAEIGFSLKMQSDDQVLCSIPITKIEQLENLMKQRFTFFIPKEYRTATYLWQRIYMFMRRPESQASAGHR